MSYRKITVDGKEYEYVTGRTHTKIKGVGVWPNDELGTTAYVHQYCECCGESMHDLYGSEPRKELEVKPHHIAAKIKIFA